MYDSKAKVSRFTSKKNAAPDADDSLESRNYFSSKTDLIHEACKQISHQKAPKKNQKYFVKRMNFDVVKRESRERTFNTIKN
jgi:hypothetical protein